MNSTLKRVRLALISIIFILSAVSCGNNTGDRDETSSDTTVVSAEPDRAFEYFPVIVDSYMKYKGTGNEYAEYESYVDYVNGHLVQIRNINPGSSSVSVYEITEEVIKRVYFVGEIYYRHDFTELRNSDEVVLQDPIEEGNTWTIDEDRIRTITGVDVEITVPMGSYMGIEVTTEFEDSVLKDYYVKGIGHVKREFVSKEVPDFVISSELEAKETNKPLAFMLTVILPDYNEGIYHYDQREVEIMTNEHMEIFFETEMKTKPPSADLFPLISENTVINYIDPLFSHDMILVDFSRELILEMNAGAGFESMILVSIAKTFALYYQINKVMLKVDGKPYSSGHIALEEGEYITVDP